MSAHLTQRMHQRHTACSAASDAAVSIPQPQGQHSRMYTAAIPAAPQHCLDTDWPVLLQVRKQLSGVQHTC
jgi:hypothetical protein